MLDRLDRSFPRKRVVVEERVDATVDSVVSLWRVVDCPRDEALEEIGCFVDASRAAPLRGDEEREELDFERRFIVP